MFFSSLPAFVSVYIPLVLLGFFGIIFEEHIAEAEQRLFKKIKRALRAKKRKAARMRCSNAPPEFFQLLSAYQKDTAPVFHVRVRCLFLLIILAKTGSLC